MTTVAVDWDDTVVDSKTRLPLPGAVAALELLLARGHRVIVHTCRANWPEGLAQVMHELAEFALAGRLDIWVKPGKPAADVYVDDRSFPPFRGDWQALLDLPLLQPKATTSGRPREAWAAWYIDRSSGRVH